MRLRRPFAAAVLAAGIACALAPQANAHAASAQAQKGMPAGVTGRSLRARWIAANLASIARIRGAKARARARRAFGATLARSGAEAAAPPSVPDLRAAAARELARLGGYELARPAPPRRPSLAARFLAWTGGLAERFLHAIFRHATLSGRAASAFADALAALFVAVALAALLFVFARLQIERAPLSRVAYEAIKPPRDAHALYLRALERARAGAYAEAVRMLFAAATAALVQRGAVADDASATVGELRRTLRGSATELLAPFDRVARAFVVAAYAEAPVEGDDWQRAHDGYRELAEEP